MENGLPSQRPVRNCRSHLPSSAGTLSESRFRITFRDRKVEVAVTVEVSRADKTVVVALVPGKRLTFRGAAGREVRISGLGGGKPELLRRCGIGSARALVVTLDVPSAVEKVITAAREERPDLIIMARARGIRLMPPNFTNSMLLMPYPRRSRRVCSFQKPCSSRSAFPWALLLPPFMKSATNFAAYCGAHRTGGKHVMPSGRPRDAPRSATIRIRKRPHRMDGRHSGPVFAPIRNASQGAHGGAGPFRRGWSEHGYGHSFVSAQPIALAAELPARARGELFARSRTTSSTMSAGFTPSRQKDGRAPGAASPCSSSANR